MNTNGTLCSIPVKFGEVQLIQNQVVQLRCFPVFLFNAPDVGNIVECERRQLTDGVFAGKRINNSIQYTDVRIMQFEAVDEPAG